jgi:hypothetical protein
MHRAGFNQPGGASSHTVEQLSEHASFEGGVQF